MALLPITLTASEKNWRLFSVRRADPAFRTFQTRVFNRDGYTCQYCGFQSLNLMEVVNRDLDYTNNRLSNLITACQFCAQCFFLEAVGRSDFGGGTLIYLPEIPQHELNAVCHLLFAALSTGHKVRYDAKNIYRSLRMRSKLVEDKLGEGMANPSLYGHLLIDSTSHPTALTTMHERLMTQVRLLPSLSRFSDAIAECTREALAQLHALT